MAQSSGGRPRPQHQAGMAAQAWSSASRCGWLRKASASDGARSLPLAAAWAAFLHRAAAAWSHSSGVAASIRPAARGRADACLGAATGAVSVPLEGRDALLDVGGDAFLGVLAGEELGLQLALDGQAVLQRDLRARLHAALDVAGGHGGLVGG